MVVGLTRFVGRDRELARVCDLVAENPLVTLTGPGGVGKTRLAAEVRDALAGHGWQVVVGELGDLPPGAGVDVLTGALGGQSPEAIALRLAEVDGVVVLDNCEHVLGAAAEFVGRLFGAGHDVAVLTTTRQPLGVPGEQVVVLDPLGPTPATELFLELAGAAGAPWERSDRNLADVARLCEEVDGLPLAIELAAARSRVLTPSELLDLLTGRLDVLRRSAGHGPDRHRSVRAAIAVSVELLDDDQRDLFRRLGVFDGPFDLRLVHAVAGPVDDDPLVTVDLLGALVERSLVVAEPSGDGTRYRMLELIREHAAELLRAEGGWDATCEQLTSAMVGEALELLAAASEKWSAEVLDRMTARFPHLVAAIDACIATDATADRAFVLFPTLFAGLHASRSAEVRAVGERLLARWPDADSPLRAETLAVLATAYAVGGEPGRATALAEEAVAAAGGEGIAAVVAERAMVLAGLSRRAYADALRHARRGREAAARVPVPPFERELRGFEATLQERNGQPHAAAALAATIADDSVAAGDAITEIWGRLVAVSVATRAGRLADARAELDRANAAAAAIGGQWWNGALRRVDAALVAAEHAATDGWVASRPGWRSAIEAAAALGDLSELALTLTAAAGVAVRHDHLGVAAALLAAAPPSTDVSVLPDVVDVDPARLAALRPVRGAGEPVRLVAAVRAALAALDDPAPSVPADGSSVRADTGPPGDAAAFRPSLRREGDVWAFTWRGDTVRVRALKGIGDLAVLLARPGQEVHCLELVGGVDVGGDAGAGLDARARREYQARITELQAEIDEAAADNDRGRAEKAELELDALVEQLSSALGLGGRDRATGSSAERARTAVTYRVRAALRRVAEQHPDLGRHLSHSVRTGTWCMYRPEQDVTWEVDARTV